MYKKYFESLLRSLFCEEANFCHIEKHTKQLIYRVDWKMPTEDQPNKRSRPIEIHLSSDTLDDYRDASSQLDREQMDRRIMKHIKIKLTAFAPEHELSSLEPPPVEVWSITPDIVSAPL